VMGATVGSGTVVGSAATVGSMTDASVAAGVPHAASKRLIATNTNSKGRTNFVISIFSYIFYTLKSYQAVFKVKRRTG